MEQSEAEVQSSEVSPDDDSKLAKRFFFYDNSNKKKNGFAHLLLEAAPLTR